MNRSTASAFPRPGLSCLSVLTLAMLHTQAHAAEHGVTSGGLLRQNPGLTRAFGTSDDSSQPSAANADVTQAGDADELRFSVRDFEFDGEMTPEERTRVDAYIAPLRGREMTLSALQVMRAELTELLYHDGESLVRVLLPQQTIEKNGVVQFQIVRGRIERVVVENASQVDTARIEAILHGTGVADPKLRDIDARMRLVRELPGVGRVDATLAPGKYPGGTLVTLTVASGPQLYGMVTGDNAGSVEAGERRIGVIGGTNNLFGRGDRFEAMVYATPNALQTQASDGGQTRLARLSYDTPVGKGASRVGAAVSYVGYRLGGEFEGLGKGSADVASIYATRPVWRTRSDSLDLAASIDHKRLHDDRFGDLLQSDRRSTVASVRADGSGVAGRGRWRRYYRYGMGVSYGGMDMTDLDRTSGDAATRKHTTFVKAAPSASIVVAPVSSLQLSAQVRGQWANRSLDGSERMSLGGPGAVRAYDLNAAAVDNAAVVSLEASHDFIIPNTRVSAFYDGAAGRYRSAMGYDSRPVNLQGAGVGVNWNWKGMQAQVSLARPIGRSSEAPKDDQLWVTVGKSF
ncbi:ShlB/FhaC/HecB family hemolysin secretion/activation protein [Lysobacter auxotrophicus]|uniref:ShlB/FhaC/HecB family hemolysin secretion/activation protein n=1 Tax=Lysobacter auxotrophicus TaxID=2992573 RepID=A0ABN6ULT4_9GAMM|nr:ShlB/FhaC/HecB family hemolysin secretion/activation protein [Lysobacter auxotrophicus]BDU17313.1 ShlB/FhaC/HecB family hemolysin secretion/activation protein [Lysobacter auxotrophicus]